MTRISVVFSMRGLTYVAYIQSQEKLTLTVTSHTPVLF